MASRTALKVTSPGFTMGNPLGAFSLSWEFKVMSSLSPKYHLRLGYINWCRRFLLKFVSNSHHSLCKQYSQLTLRVSTACRALYIPDIHPLTCPVGDLVRAHCSCMKRPHHYCALQMGVRAGVSVESWTLPGLWPPLLPPPHYCSNHEGPHSTSQAL